MIQASKQGPVDNTATDVAAVAEDVGVIVPTAGAWEAEGWGGSFKICYCCSCSYCWRKKVLLVIELWLQLFDAAAILEAFQQLATCRNYEDLIYFSLLPDLILENSFKLCLNHFV